jgi:conjugative transposon TraM protein
MEKQTQSPKFLRQRRFVTVLPLLILPFITLMFWALGGGKTQTTTAETQKQQGFNMRLPDAYLKEDKTLDKMSYYNKAQADSARLRQLMKNDPYYQLSASDTKVKKPSSGVSKYKRSNSERINPSSYNGTRYQDPHEAKVYQKLEELNTALNKASVASEPASSISPLPSASSNVSVNSSDIERLEQMMHVMNQPGEEDPEMQKLNGMLERILDIQHPERVKEKIRQTSAEKQGQVFAVSAASTDNPVFLIDNRSVYGVESDSVNTYHTAAVSNGFYGLEENEPEQSNANHAIEAVIHETQTLVNGSTVKLRLVSDIYINGVLIPKDHFLFGLASLNGERLQVTISSIRYQHSLFPVELSVYDLDGISGIYIPGAISRDVAKQSTEGAIQSMNLNSLNTSIGAQAANAGIEMAKTLLGKKIKLIKVTVKAGYQVLLRDEKQQQNL